MEKNNKSKNEINPFLKMDAETMYWLGYIFADGNIAYNEKQRQYSISLFSKDLDILYKFKKFLGPLSKMYVRNTGIGQVIYRSKSVTKWFINTFDVGPNKSLILDPNIELNWDLLHGYFDGDGCVRLTDPHKEAKFTTGSLVWAGRIREFLLKYNIENKIIKKGNAYDVNIYKKDSVKLLYQYMYQNNTSRLEYKYNRFVALFDREKFGELLES